MRVPERLESLLEQGVLHSVLRPLLSGKEAEVYLVERDGELRVAKVFKEVDDRSFKHRAAYTEGRKVRNSREQRAMSRKSKFGREQIEEAWRSAEVDAIYRLQAAGVRVPRPYDYVDGVLVMELIAGENGEPAPRLADVSLSPEEAKPLFFTLLREVVRMLCAGVVHGDLSDFNVLISANGPVIIDFPQAVDPAANNNAGAMLVRDVDNLTKFLGRWAPELRDTQYGKEMWSLYERNQLTPETRLTGKHRGSSRRADTNALLAEIEAIEREARARREALGLEPRRPARAARVVDAPPPTPASPRERAPKGNAPVRAADRAPDRGRKPHAPSQPPEPKPARAAEPSFDDLDALLSFDD